MGNELLAITDGTVRVNLLNRNGGLLLYDWIPQIAEPKDGGVWNENPMSDGRRMAFKAWGNVIETFEIRPHGGSQDIVILQLRVLRTLLEKAVSYWMTNIQTEPVWIEARGPCETNIRYALIYDWRTPQDSNPFAQPFFSENVAMDDFTLAIERGHWQDMSPITEVDCDRYDAEHYPVHTATNPCHEHDVPLDTIRRTQTPPHNVGQEQTSDWDKIFVRNCDMRAEITHVISAGATHALGTIPFDLTSSGPVIGDIIYIGSEYNAFMDTGPLHNVIFDLTRVATTITGWTIRHSMAAGWTASLMVRDDTNNFSVLGVHGIYISPLTTFDHHVESGIDAYWIKIEITAVSGVSATPVEQGNRFPYHAKQPWAHIQLDTIGGDIPALSKIKMAGVFDSYEPYQDGNFDRCLLALRSAYRDVGNTEFTPYLECCDYNDVPSGVDCQVGSTLYAIGYGSWAIPPLATPTGRSIKNVLIDGGTGPFRFATWNFNPNNMETKSYYGVYRAFARYMVVPGWQWCLHLNGAVCSVNCGSGATLDNLPLANFTVEGWYKPDATGFQNAIYKYNWGTGVGWWIGKDANERLRVVIHYATTNIIYTVPAYTAFAIDTWYHIAVCLDSAKKVATVYIDGKYVGESLAGKGAYVTDAAENLSIGLDNHATFSWWRLSKSIRYTSDFIPTRYPPEIDTETIEQWNFNDGAGATVIASVTTPANNGAITNGTWQQWLYAGIGAGDYRFRYDVWVGSTVKVGDWVSTPSFPNYTLRIFSIDLGIVNMNPGYKPNDRGETIKLNISLDHAIDETWAFVNAEVSAVYLVDVILLPADEWLGDFYSSGYYGFPVNGDYFLEVDSIGIPKGQPMACIYNTSIKPIPYNYEDRYTAISPPSILQVKNPQKLFFYCTKRSFTITQNVDAALMEQTTTEEISDPYTVINMAVFKLQRYLSMRGTG